MDSDSPLLLLLIVPFAVLISGYLLAWRAKRAKLRKVGSWSVAVVSGLVGLFASRWALATLYGLAGDIRRSGSSSWRISDVLEGLLVLGIVLILPAGALHISYRFIKISLRINQRDL
jgi:RsiW-degrading membrane proteinase PrsW (M82 family)